MQVRSKDQQRQPLLQLRQQLRTTTAKPTTTTRASNNKTYNHYKQQQSNNQATDHEDYTQDYGDVTTHNNTPAIPEGCRQIKFDAITTMDDGNLYGFAG
jgi:hypothetical protein